MPQDLVPGTTHPLSEDAGGGAATGTQETSGEMTRWGGAICEETWMTAREHLTHGKTVGSDGLSAETLTVLNEGDRSQTQRLLEHVSCPFRLPEGLGDMVRVHYPQAELSEHHARASFPIGMHCCIQVGNEVRTGNLDTCPPQQMEAGPIRNQGGANAWRCSST